MRSSTFVLGSLLFLGCSSEENGGGAGENGGSGAGAGAATSTGTGGGTSPGTGGNGGGPAASGSSGGVSGGGGEGGGAPGTGGTGVGFTPGDCEQPGVVTRFTPLLFSDGADPSGDPSCAIVNPERGFRSVVNLRGSNNFGNVRSNGYSTVYGYLLIDDYIGAELDDEVLGPLEESFAALRAAGVKVLFRVYYAPAMDPDAPLDLVLRHIEQLTPLLQANADVIAAMHAGFVGAWGEWHSSTNNLTEPSSRKAIMDALLVALPPDRMILARRPSHKEDAYGGPLTSETAYAGTPMSRVGHLNDCFLASDSDFGTYANEAERAYARDDSAFTVVEGETCAVNAPRSECATALDEFAAHHFSLLNIAYNGDVLDSWRAGGCFDEIACRLGYRYALLGHEVPGAVSAGSVLNVSVGVINDGFARAFNPRPVFLVLEGNGTQVQVPVDMDLRDLAPGVAHSFCLGALVPADLAPGEYRVGLWMPDAADTLQADERYAVRLANDVEWSGGVNFLDATVLVE